MGVEDLVAVAQEAAMTRHLGRLLAIEQALTESLRRFRKRGEYQERLESRAVVAMKSRCQQLP